MRRDIASAYLLTGTRLLSWLIVLALVYRRMGEGAFATLTLVRATVGLLNYASLGIAPAMIHLLAKINASAQRVLLVETVTDNSDAPGDVIPYASPATQRSADPIISPLQTLYFSGLMMTCVSALLAMVLLGVYTALFAEGSLKVAIGLKAEIGDVVGGFGAAMILKLISDASGAVLQAGRRVALDNILLTFSELSWLVMCVFLIDDDWNHLPRVAFASAIASLLALIGRIAGAEGVARIIGVKVRLDGKLGAQLLAFGMLVTLAQVADFLYAPTDYLLINQLLGPRLVSIYAPAVQIDGGLLLLVTALSSVLLPHSALAHAAGDANTLRRYYVRGTLVSLLLLACASAIIYFASPLLFKLWLDDPMTATRAILPLILIHTIIGGSSAVGRSVLLGMGKVKPFTAAVLIAGVANVILSYIFVRHLHLGLNGIIYGTILAVVGRCVIWMPWYVLRSLAPSRQ
jgi:O-antigen/teichoic acid export membrane protein